MITVEQRDVEVTRISLMVEHDDVRVYLIECGEKRPRVFHVADDGVARLLIAPQHRGSPETATAITLPDGWYVLAEDGRYAIRVVLYRDAGGHQIWPEA